MKAGMSLTAAVPVAALFMTLAALCPAGSKVYADSQAAKLVTITPVKLIPTPPVCGGRGEGGTRQEPRFDGPGPGDPPPPPQNYVFTFKKPEHYHYEIKGKTLVSGTSFPANDRTITIAAVPDSGYTFGKAPAKWDYNLMRVRCGG